MMINDQVEEEREALDLYLALSLEKNMWMDGLVSRVLFVRTVCVDCVGTKAKTESFGLSFG